MKDVPEISVDELKDELASNNPPVLLDVREEYEVLLCKLDIDHNIPMGQVMVRVRELSQSDDIVVICQVGDRSSAITSYLLAQGFEKVRNLSGGMSAWSRKFGL